MPCAQNIHTENATFLHLLKYEMLLIKSTSLIKKNPVFITGNA